jgi:hypothetical protein
LYTDANGGLEMRKTWRAAIAVLKDERGGCSPMPPEFATGVLVFIGVVALVIFLALGSWVTR